MNLARMRTQAECMKQLRQDDPGTCFTAHALRQGILADLIPHVRCGRRILVNYDGLLSYLANPQQSKPEPQQYGKIRRIYD